MKELEFKRKIDPGVLGAALVGLIVPKSMKVSDTWQVVTVTIADDEAESEVRRIVEAHVPERKRLVFPTAHDLSQLHDEMLAAIPALRPIPGAQIDPSGKRSPLPVMSAEGSADRVILTVLADADEQVINKVLKAHVPKPPSAPLTQAELRDHLKKAKTTEDLKLVVESVLDRMP